MTQQCKEQEILSTMPNSKPWMGKRFVRVRGNTSQKVTFLLFVFIISIPVTSIYIGYAIATYLSGGHHYLPDIDVIVGSYRLNYTWYNTHNLTVTFGGGLGNRMFQYASMYGVAKANGLKPIIPADLNLLDAFSGLRAKTVPVKEPGKRYLKFRESSPNMFDSRAFSLNFMKNIQLVGFYQSWRFFDHVRYDINRQFRFRPQLEEKVNNFLADVMNRHKEAARAKSSFKTFPIQFVGIHVRRGDLLNQASLDQGYIPADLPYFKKAMSAFVKKFQNVIFIVASDDIEWCRTNLKSVTSPVIFSPFSHDQYIDLCLLSKCNHSIISAGTFGWWGAWLAGGETLYFKDFPKRYSKMDSGFKHQDYYVPQWIGI